MNINIEEILKLIAIGHDVVEMVTKLVQNAGDALSEEDAAKLDDALKELQASNDAAFDRIKQKLQEAKSRS